MHSGFWGALWWAVFTALIILFLRGSKVVDVNALEAEVNAELAKEAKDKAKSQLKAINRDIANAEQIVENLRRKKKDLLLSIGEGTN